MKNLKQTLLALGGLALMVSAPLAARANRPEGWKVKVSHQALLAKQSIYSFTVSVRDEAGKPVDDATVHLRIPSFQRDEPRLLPARRVGKGRYYASTHLPIQDSAKYVRAVVEPGAGSR